MTQEVRDPVCGMMVDPRNTKHSSEYKGKTYYFCSPSCKAQFDQVPEKVVETAAG